VWRELEEALGVVPDEERTELPAAPPPVDELARRRRERRTG